MWIVIESGPEGLEVYPYENQRDAISAIGKIIYSLSGYYALDLASGTWAQVISDNGLVLLPMNRIAENPVTLYAREVQL